MRLHRCAAAPEPAHPCGDGGGPGCVRRGRGAAARRTCQRYQHAAETVRRDGNRVRRQAGTPCLANLSQAPNGYPATYMALSIDELLCVEQPRALRSASPERPICTQRRGQNNVSVSCPCKMRSYVAVQQFLQCVRSTVAARKAAAAAARKSKKSAKSPASNPASNAAAAPAAPCYSDDPDAPQALGFGRAKGMDPEAAETATGGAVAGAAEAAQSPSGRVGLSVQVHGPVGCAHAQAGYRHRSGSCAPSMWARSRNVFQFDRVCSLGTTQPCGSCCRATV